MPDGTGFEKNQESRKKKQNADDADFQTLIIADKKPA
jgi:hypothetical protein